MRLIIRTAAALLAFLVVLAAILVFRTLTYDSPVADHADAALQPAPPSDIQQAAEHLAEAIRFRTITEQDGTR